MSSVFHLLGLHMHQPPDNLRLLIDSNEWEARQIMLCYDRPLKYARQYRDVARFSVGFSGILLEQLQDPCIVSRYSGIVDIPRMLDAYRNTPNIEIVGMGYYHPVFPLIPVEDWDEQIERGKKKVMEVFGREPSLFWPPEMAFTREMIPHLVRNGYRQVVIDHVHVKPVDSESIEEIAYQTHIAEYGGKSITVIPRDRDLSNAQESGLDPAWLENQIRQKIAEPDQPRLVTTWTDGENGGWFRQTDEGSGFWGYFFAPYMERVRSGQSFIRPIPASDFVRDHPPKDRVDVQTGAWNVASTSGFDFSQWAATPAQKKALDEIWQLSLSYREIMQSIDPARRRSLEEQLRSARESILRSETSCYLFWGDSWIPKLHEQTGIARRLLEKIRN
jgi:alpha-amylase/alpha-mannosidase (GH57 family)